MRRLSPRHSLRRSPRTAQRGRRTGVAGVVLVLLMSLFGLLVARLGQVQLVQGAQLTTQAASVHTRTITEHALRGQILDRTGAPFVTNAFSTVVTVERSVLLDADDGGRALVRSVAAVLGQPFDRLWGKTMLCGTAGAPRAPACFNGSPYVPIPIATGVDPQRALTLMEQPEKFPGIGVTPEPARSYPRPRGPTRPTCSAGSPGPAPTTSSPAAGAIDAEDVVGRSGLEAQYDAVLRGRNGATVVAIDPRGVVTETLLDRNPVPGSDVVTHLDARLQARTEAALARTVAKARADGCAPTPRPRSSSTSPTARSSRRPATRHTTPRCSPAASARRSSTG